MNIDIRTLIFVLGITHVIQVVVFSLQYKANKNYRGVGWWLLWSAVEILSFACMLLRGLPNAPLFVIFAQNLLLVFGTVFLYIGILRFLGRQERRRLIVGLSALFAAALLYFLYGINDIAIRGIIVSTALALVSFESARALWVGRQRAFAASACFLAAVFLLHGAIFSYRALRIMAGASVANFFDPSPFNVVAFLDAIVVALLWTYGLIMLLNQRAQADLAEAKEEVETLFDASPDAILLTRLDDGQVVRCNDGFLALSGHIRAETIGQTSLTLRIWKDPADRARITRELREHGACVNLELLFQNKAGQDVCCLMSAKVIELHGGPHIISITHDISRRKRVEAERAALEAQNQQLQKSESLGRMAGAIAHHFNNKLQVVTGNLELALAARTQGPDRNESLAAAMEATREAADMSGLMLTYLGRTSGEQVRLDLAELCQAALPVLQSEIALTSDLTLETNFPVPGPTVQGNAKQLQQILTQLVANAREACKVTPATIRVTVKTVPVAAISLSSCQPIDWRPLAPVYACLEVRDTGSGISGQDLKMIFDPFFSTKFVGRGLGLAVVLGLVRVHEGAIQVTSAPGQGSVFSVYIPLLG